MPRRNPRERAERGRRLAALREEQSLTVVELAKRLNVAAGDLGLPQRWTGPKVSKIEVGGQDFTIEDVAVLDRYDPQRRGWFWWYFGRELPGDATTAPASALDADLRRRDQELATAILASPKPAAKPRRAAGSKHKR